MKVLRRVILVALAGSPLAAHPVAAQTPAADLVTAARAQLWKGNADSGLALLRLALDSSTRATASDRMNALVWRGVLQYYKGQDSLARESFRDALTIDPRLEVAGLAQVDSILAVEFEGVRRSIQLPPKAPRPPPLPPPARGPAPPGPARATGGRSPRRHAVQLRSRLPRPRPASPGPVGDVGDRRAGKRRGHPRHGGHRAGTVCGGYRRWRGGDLDHRGHVAQPRAAGDSDRSRSPGAVRARARAGASRARLDAVAPQPAESMKQRPHAPVMVL